MGYFLFSINSMCFIFIFIFSSCHSLKLQFPYISKLNKSIRQVRKTINEFCDYVPIKKASQSFCIFTFSLSITFNSFLSTSYGQIEENSLPVEYLKLKQGYKEVTYLINNWDEKTTYCNFGDFKRDLLKKENKEKLLIAAAETGILDYDKSATMVMMCKKDPMMVRALLGLTNDNKSLIKAEDFMRKPTTVSKVDPDFIEEYFAAVDSFSQAISEIDSLTYEARFDFGSVENSMIGQDNVASTNDYLQQSKLSTIHAKESLEKILTYLNIL